jgi:hypothetical protein
MASKYRTKLMSEMLLYSFVGASTFNGYSATEFPAFPIRVAQDTFVYDSWFFVAPSGSAQHGRGYKTSDFVVHSNEEFGISFKYFTRKKNVNVTVVLRAPSKSENFGCKGCRPGELIFLRDGKTVVVKKVENASDYFGFYWGISDEDPRGQYRMEMYLEDVLIDSYKINVI